MKNLTRMTILDRYIGSAVVMGTLLSLTVLVAMFNFFAMIEVLEDVGKGNFGVWDAMEYLLLTLHDSPANA